MLSKLTAYYDQVGISAKSYEHKRLKCPHFDQCSLNRRPFVPAKEAFVSTRYEDHDIPRLLVISLDPKPTPFYELRENRTLLAIREHEELTPTESYYDWSEKSHWRKTFDMVFSLLREFIMSRDRKEVRHFFAHTNSAKCHDNAGSDQASDELFFNCSEYLPEEIKILDPDVVITQGADRYFSFMKPFLSDSEWGFLKPYSDLKKVHSIMHNDHNAIWIETNHPCRHDSSYQQEDVNHFPRYRELIAEFWKRSQ